MDLVAKACQSQFMGKAESGKSPVQDLLGLRSEFQASMGNLVKTSLKMTSERNLELSFNGRRLPTVHKEMG